MTRNAAIVAAALLMPAPVASQADARGGASQLASEYTLDHWDDLDGLPQNSIQAIAQTADGYLWVGTQEGLARFDGVRFVTVPIGDRSQPFVTDLLANPDTSLWVAYADRLELLHRGERRRLIAFGGFPDRAVSRLYRDDRNRVWVGFDDGSVAYVEADATGPVAFAGRGRPGAVRAFAESGDGRLFVGFDAGLGVLVSDESGFALRMVSARPARSIAPDRTGEIVVGSTDGVYRLRGGDLARTGAPRRPTTAVRAASGGGFWLASGRQLLRIGPALEDASAAYPIGDLVLALFEDREDNLWIGTSGKGLARLRRTVVAMLGEPEGLSADNIQSIHHSSEDEVWIGTAGGGLNRIRGTDVDTFSVEGGQLPSDVVFSIAQSDGVVWAGTAFGVVAIDPRTGSTRAIEGLRNRQVRVIVPARAGGVWIGGSEGLERYAPGRGVLESYGADVLGSDAVYSVREDSAGGLWVGTSAGLLRRQGARFVADPALTAGIPRAVLDIDITSDAVLLATTDGLVRIVDGQATLFGAAEGACADHAHAVVVDRDGRIWSSSNRGLQWLWPHELDALASGEVPTLPCRPVGRAAGMRSREANGGASPAGTLAPDGRIWFPTVQGVAIVDPARVGGNGEAPPVVVEQVSIDDDSLDALAPVVPASGRHLSIRFTGLTLVESETLRFRYMLEGYDPGWMEAQESRRAEYTNLPPGRYRFRLAAAAPDGTWGSDETVLPVVVRAHVWETVWFQALMVGLLLACVLVAHRWRVRVIEGRRRQVHELEQARTRAETLAVDARLRALRLELHPHFFFNTLNGISGLIRDGDQRSALDLLHRFADLTRATLESRESRTRPLREEIAYIRDYLELEAVRFGDRLEVELDVGPESLEVPVPPLILQPLVENAIRHGVARTSRHARLHVTARRDDGVVKIRVEDNGPGFREGLDELPAGTGLRNVRERLQATYGHRAGLRLVPGQAGATVELFIPANGGPP